MKLEELQTPALLVRLDRVRSNIARMVGQVGGRFDCWRPHIKTAKIPEILDLLLDAGLRRFKCATTREARVLLGRASEPVDLLVAMPHRGANLGRVVELAAEFPRHRLSILTEDPDHAREVRATSPELGLYLDLNPGFDRTGIPRTATERIHDTAHAAGPALRGLHDYEGHIRDPDATRRTGACRAIYGQLVEIAQDVRRRGAVFDELLTSGTPTFAHALRYAPFAEFDHQVSPGTVVYWDGLSESFGLRGFLPAVEVLTRVVSIPCDGVVTCDAGGKAVDAAVEPPCARVDNWPGLVARRPSEEHLPLDVVGGAAPRPGTLLRLIPAHVCPTVNLADMAVLLEGDSVVSTTRIAARGHELIP